MPVGVVYLDGTIPPPSLPAASPPPATLAPTVTVNFGELVNVAAANQPSFSGQVAPGSSVFMAETAAALPPPLIVDFGELVNLTAANQPRFSGEVAPGSPEFMEETAAAQPRPDESELPDLMGEQFAGNPPLRGAEFVQYVRRQSDARNLDDIAVFANAMAEGLGGGMGDSGTSFGPWNMHQRGALPKKYWGYPAFSPLVQAWTWTEQGIDYALDSMVKASASGLRGHAAVHAIVERFERPANIGGQEVIRDDYYDALKGMGDPYSYLAARAAGPSITGVIAPPVKTAPGRSAIGAKGRWQDVIEVLFKGLPKTQDRIDAQGEALREVFR